MEAAANTGALDAAARLAAAAASNGGVDIDAAIATMTKAVLYETPWDEDNIEANKVLLMEIKQA